MAQQTLDHLYELRLTGMAEALEEQMRMSGVGLDFEERFALLLEREVTVRDDRRLTRLLRTAKLSLQAGSGGRRFSRTPWLRSLRRVAVGRLSVDP